MMKLEILHSITELVNFITEAGVIKKQKNIFKVISVIIGEAIRKIP